MFKKILSIVLALSVSSAFAAKFSPVSTLKDAKLEATAKAFAKELKEGVFVLGDCSSVVRLKVEKKASELNLNSMKQLSIIKGGLFQDDDETVVLINGKTSQLAEDFITVKGLREYQDEDEENASKKFIASLTKLLNSKSSQTELYFGVHSNEDGTWGLIQAFDTKNLEVLVLKAGYCGT